MNLQISSGQDPGDHALVSATTTKLEYRQLKNYVMSILSHGRFDLLQILVASFLHLPQFEFLENPGADLRDVVGEILTIKLRDIRLYQNWNYSEALSCILKSSTKLGRLDFHISSRQDKATMPQTYRLRDVLLSLDQCQSSSLRLAADTEPGQNSAPSLPPQCI
jgi:hypothetical protein